MEQPEGDLTVGVRDELCVGVKWVKLLLKCSPQVNRIFTGGSSTPLLELLIRAARAVTTFGSALDIGEASSCPVEPIGGYRQKGGSRELGGFRAEKRRCARSLQR